MILTCRKIVTSGFQHPTVPGQRPDLSGKSLIRIGADGAALDALEKMVLRLSPLKYTDAIAQALVGSGRRRGSEPEIAGGTLVALLHFWWVGDSDNPVVAKKSRLFELMLPCLTHPRYATSRSEQPH